MCLTSNVTKDIIQNMEKYGPYEIVKEEEFDIENSNWLTIKIKDSEYMIELKPAIARVLQTSSIDDNTGYPIYVVLSTNLMRVKKTNAQ